MSKLIYFRKHNIYYGIVSKINNPKYGNDSIHQTNRFILLLEREEIFDEDFIQKDKDSWNRRVRYLKAYINKHPEELI